jgi:hypothetical protein
MKIYVGLCFKIQIAKEDLRTFKIILPIIIYVYRVNTIEIDLKQILLQKIYIQNMHTRVRFYFKHFNLKINFKGK